MNCKSIVLVALLAGLASPAFAQGTRTIDVWGNDVQVPNQAPDKSMRRTGEGHSRTAPAAGSRLPLSAGDEDDDNAKNPALPSSERGRGQETGGPARNLIPD
jgi:hypothetical protein